MRFKDLTGKHLDYGLYLKLTTGVKKMGNITILAGVSAALFLLFAPQV